LFFLSFLFPLWSIRLISQFHDHFTDGRTYWTDDQLVKMPIPKHRTTQTQKNLHTTNIHALSKIRTHDPGIRASEKSACLRRLGYRDGRNRNTWKKITSVPIFLQQIPHYVAWVGTKAPALGSWRFKGRR
jgi:hypothetical protein